MITIVSEDNVNMWSDWDQQRFWMQEDTDSIQVGRFYFSSPCHEFVSCTLGAGCPKRLQEELKQVTKVHCCPKTTGNTLFCHDGRLCCFVTVNTWPMTFYTTK